MPPPTAIVRASDSDFADEYIVLAEHILAPLYPVLAKTTLTFCKNQGLQPASVLDIGGGTGQWLEALINEGVLFGCLLELEPAMLAHAQKRLSETFPTFPFSCLGGTAGFLPFRGMSFDLVVSRNSMHMWPNLLQCWEEIFRTLRPGGIAFIGRGYGPDLSPELRKEIKDRRKARRIEQNEDPTPEPQSPPSDDVCTLCRKAGFHTIETIPDGKSYWIADVK